MSNIQKYENIKQLVSQVEIPFTELAKIHNAVNFKREASFALQIMQKNTYLADLANANPDSLKNAIINVAAIGLSLSPVHKLAYLIPRKKEVCLDLSYRGLVQLATDCGAVKWVVAELVYKKDKFKLKGLGKEPQHEFDPFAEDRGELVGAYCTAKTLDGDFLVTHMKIKDVYDIRNRSESWKNGGQSPWKSDESEMIKKTVVRRAYKSWPSTESRKRFDEAIDVTNTADPVEFLQPIEVEKDFDFSEKLTEIREKLKSLDRTEDKYIKHLCTVCRREIKSLEDLNESEITSAISMLDQLILKEKSKADNAALQMSELDKKIGIENENA